MRWIGEREGEGDRGRGRVRGRESEREGEGEGEGIVDKTTLIMIFDLIWVKNN
jgi:hypothetical protein